MDEVIALQMRVWSSVFIVFVTWVRSVFLIDQYIPVRLQIGGLSVDVKVNKSNKFMHRKYH